MLHTTRQITSRWKFVDVRMFTDMNSFVTWPPSIDLFNLWTATCRSLAGPASLTYFPFQARPANISS